MTTATWMTNLGQFRLENPTPEQLEALDTLGFTVTLEENHG